MHACLNVFWNLSAVGFWLILGHWLTYERKMSKVDYRTGFYDGVSVGWDDAVREHDKGGLGACVWPDDVPLTAAERADVKGERDD